MRLRRQLQPSQRRRPVGLDLTDDGCGRSAAKRLLQRPQDVGFTPCLDNDKPRGVQPEGGESRSVQSGHAPTPHNRAAASRQPPRQYRSEADCRDAAVDSKDLVEGGMRQATPGKGDVDRGDTERQRLDVAAAEGGGSATAEPSDTGFQCGNHRRIRPRQRRCPGCCSGRCRPGRRRTTVHASRLQKASGESPLFSMCSNYFQSRRQGAEFATGAPPFRGHLGLERFPRWWVP